MRDEIKSTRQRLKEWYKSGKSKAKTDTKRASLEVSQCFSSLLKWIVYWLPETNQELPMAIDATNIGQKEIGGKALDKLRYLQSFMNENISYIHWFRRMSFSW